MTECAPVVSTNTIKFNRLGSVGRPLPCSIVKIENGEIFIRGDNVMLGYYNDTKSTNDVLKDGWLSTGDLGFLDKDGYLYVTGRKKNIIILENGENVSAEEIDKMLEGTKMYGMGSAFVKAEQTYGVNALYLMGLACLESAYGSSNYAVNRNNLYGWEAYDSNPDNAKKFDSREYGTMFVAEKLKVNYLTEGGKWFEGYSARAVDVHYCTDKLHADKIVNIVSRLTKKLGQYNISS